jgi:hypothetical protein
VSKKTYLQEKNIKNSVTFYLLLNNINTIDDNYYAFWTYYLDLSNL